MTHIRVIGRLALVAYGLTMVACTSFSWTARSLAKTTAAADVGCDPASVVIVSEAEGPVGQQTPDLRGNFDVVYRVRACGETRDYVCTLTRGDNLPDGGRSIPFESRAIKEQGVLRTVEEWITCDHASP